LKLFMLK
jgi:hypothetical protein